MLSLTTMAVAVVAISLLYVCYKMALPRPLPGIPYNAAAAKHILGDIPSLIAEVSKTNDLMPWLLDQNLKSGSVINQIFIRPLGKPLVLIADYREARDIQLNRSQDFDRSDLTIEMFAPIAKTQFVVKTGPEWKWHRRLVQDTMTPAFLRDVAAPTIHARSQNFLNLWRKKAEIADGRPFAAMEDLFHAGFDAVLAFVLGHEFPHSAIEPHMQALKNLSKSDVKMSSGSSLDDPVQFPKSKLDDVLSLLLRLGEYVGEVQSMPVPGLNWMYITRTSLFKRCNKNKYDTIRNEISKSLAKRGQKDGKGDEEIKIHHAVDLVVDREERLAARENRKPEFYNEALVDELYGLLIAGHDTTASTMSWAVKLLADHPEAQSRLRQELRRGYSAAVSEHRVPSASEIANVPVPYLDAAIEEVLRVGLTIPIGARQANRDTTVLGHRIPKGTSIWYLQNGPGFLMPSAKVDESLRSKRSQDDKAAGRVHDWNDDDRSLFKPERWLVETPVEGNTDEKMQNKGQTTTVFDPNAGPTAPFGMGPRGCFGRRLAYVELKILLTMIIWNFELLPIPKELNSYRGRLSIVYKPQEAYVRLRAIDLTVDN